MARQNIGKVVGFTAIYALVDSSLEHSRQGEKRVLDHILAVTTAAAWVHAASTRSTANITKAILGGAALGVISAPTYYGLFNLLEPRAKSIRAILLETVPQVSPTNQSVDLKSAAQQEESK